MALELVTQSIESVRGEAEATQARFTKRHADIDADPSLSEEGKRAAHSDNADQFRPLLKSLRAKEVAIITDAIARCETRIESAAGHTSGEIIAFRDAQDRADRLEDAEDADRLLQRALRQGDTSLAHAIFRVALERGYTTAANTFTANSPDMSDVVKELRTLTEMRDGFEVNWERTVHYGLFA